MHDEDPARGDFPLPLTALPVQPGNSAAGDALNDSQEQELEGGSAPAGSEKTEKMWQSSSLVDVSPRVGEGEEQAPTVEEKAEAEKLGDQAEPSTVDASTPDVLATYPSVPNESSGSDTSGGSDVADISEASNNGPDTIVNGAKEPIPGETGAETLRDDLQGSESMPETAPVVDTVDDTPQTEDRVDPGSASSGVDGSGDNTTTEDSGKGTGEPKEMEEMTSPVARGGEAAAPEGEAVTETEESVPGHPEGEENTGNMSTQDLTSHSVEEAGRISVVPFAFGNSPRLRRWTTQFLVRGKEMFPLMQKADIAKQAEKRAESLRSSMEILHNTTAFFNAFRAQQRGKNTHEKTKRLSAASVPASQQEEPNVIPEEGFDASSLPETGAQDAAEAVDTAVSAEGSNN